MNVQWVIFATCAVIFGLPSSWGTEQFTPDQGDARIIAKIATVQCGYAGSDFQAYEAWLDVESVLRGQVEKRIKIEFSRYRDEKQRLGDNGVAFLPGERTELILTRYKNYWAVQFPFHKRVIETSASRLPDCRTPNQGS